LAPFLEKTSLDRAPGRFADNLFVRKHAKADVLLTTVMGLLRRGYKSHRPPGTQCDALWPERLVPKRLGRKSLTGAYSRGLRTVGPFSTATDLPPPLSAAPRSHPGSRRRPAGASSSPADDIAAPLARHEP